MTVSVHQAGKSAKRAAHALASQPAETLNRALLAISSLLDANGGAILEANQLDLIQARELVERGELTSSAVDRLRLSPQKIREMSASVRAIAALPEVLGKVLDRIELDTGLELEKISCPLGVLAVIFEARPDAVTQISALAIKSGNAVILKPGKEVERTATVLVGLIRDALVASKLPEDAVSLVVGREAVAELLKLSEFVDLVIPRGSKALVEYVQSATRIPVLGHAEGICHIYVDEAADTALALDVIEDAKTDYPAACNAVETVLIHRAIAARFLPLLRERMSAARVRVLGCEETQAILAGSSAGLPVEPVNKWNMEYCDLVLAVRVVPDMEAAIEHIHHYGSGHTESILTGDREKAERFLRDVDAAGVYHNVSTRFADGFRYGFGAEVGVSTSKLHARGPVGLDGLTTYKYLLRGNGQIVGDYHGEAARPFLHRRHGS
jgi:glutamate-5-semialdehyde dehydrogenase